VVNIKPLCFGLCNLPTCKLCVQFLLLPFVLWLSYGIKVIWDFIAREICQLLRSPWRLLEDSLKSLWSVIDKLLEESLRSPRSIWGLNRDFWGVVEESLRSPWGVLGVSEDWIGTFEEWWRSPKESLRSLRSPWGVLGDQWGSVIYTDEASSSMEGLVKLSLNSVLAPFFSIGTLRDAIEACPK